MVQTLIPRPIAWVLSENKNHSYNLAPFSYFNAVSSDPPLIMLSIGQKSKDTAKDTCINIQQRNFFTVHIAHREMLEALNESSMTLVAGESELDLLKLATTTMKDAPLPRLENCRIAYACEFVETHKISNSSQSIIYGRVNAIYIDDNIVSTNERGHIKVHAEKLDPVSRLGADEYMGFGEVIHLKRPK